MSHSTSDWTVWTIGTTATPSQRFGEGAATRHPFRIRDTLTASGPTDSAVPAVNGLHAVKSHVTPSHCEWLRHMDGASPVCCRVPRARVPAGGLDSGYGAGSLSESESLLAAAEGPASVTDRWRIGHLLHDSYGPAADLATWRGWTARWTASATLKTRSLECVESIGQRRRGSPCAR